MPTTTNITTTYAGESAGKYISASLLSANTIENGGLTVMPNIKFRSTMKKLNTDDLLKDGTCDFDPTSTVDLTERVLEPKELQVNLNLCKQDFRSDWDAISMGYSAYDNLPPSFQEYLIAYVGSKIAQRCELNIWQGNGAVTGQHDGFVQLLTGVTLPAGQDLTGVAIDESNVIAELGRVVDAIPNSLYGNEGLKIYAPQNVIRAYVRALGGFASGIGAAGINDQGTTWYNGNANALTFDGVQLFMANGLPNDTMLSTTVDNLFFGTGVENDKNEVKILDMADLDGSQNVRMVWRFTAGVQYGNSEDIVAYNI
jgi:hypothetical protein